MIAIELNMGIRLNLVLRAIIVIHYWKPLMTQESGILGELLLFTCRFNNEVNVNYR